MNHPPQVVFPPDEENELVLLADVEKVDVVAFDEDGDLVLFDWSGVPADVEIPPDPPQPLNYGDQPAWLSTYRVPWDQRIDGRTIEVVVSDLDKDVTIEWHVTVEQ